MSRFNQGPREVVVFKTYAERHRGLDKNDANRKKEQSPLALGGSSPDQKATDDIKADTLWRKHANCAGKDLEIFFPERGASTKEAKEICSKCDVKETCLENNIDEKFGIWGGTTERERRRIRRVRAAERKARGIEQST